MTFALPDLQGRVPVHQGQGPGISQNYIIGDRAGLETVKLTTQQLPVHNHNMMASTATATNPNPTGNILATSPTIDSYVVDVAGPQLAAGAIQNSGGDQPHENLMPYQCISFIISLSGVFPTRS
jgi:microcystin-dependent protein